MHRSGLLQLSLILPLAISAAEKPRVFVTESGPIQVSGDVSGQDLKGALSFSGGLSPQNIEVMKTFLAKCPEVTITGDRDKAEYIVRLDHEPASPQTPFVHGNKVAVFNKNQDLLYSGSTRLLASAVRNACAAILGRPVK